MSQVKPRQARLFDTSLQRDPVLNLLLTAIQSGDFGDLLRHMHQLRRENAALERRLQAAQDMLRLNAQEAESHE